MFGVKLHCVIMTPNRASPFIIMSLNRMSPLVILTLHSVKGKNLITSPLRGRVRVEVKFPPPSNSSHRSEEDLSRST